MRHKPPVLSTGNRLSSLWLVLVHDSSAVLWVSVNDSSAGLWVSVNDSSSLKQTPRQLYTFTQLPLQTRSCLYHGQSVGPLSVSRIIPVIRTASAKNCRFHVPQPTFLFPLETPLRLSRNMLHGWKNNSMLAKPLTACAYLSSIVSELYDA